MSIAVLLQRLTKGTVELRGSVEQWVRTRYILNRGTRLKHAG
jgi:hypothetical protein